MSVSCQNPLQKPFIWYLIYCCEFSIYIKNVDIRNNICDSYRSHLVFFLCYYKKRIVIIITKYFIAMNSIWIVKAMIEWIKNTWKHFGLCMGGSSINKLLSDLTLVSVCTECLAVFLPKPNVCRNLRKTNFCSISNANVKKIILTITLIIFLILGFFWTGLSPGVGDYSCSDDQGWNFTKISWKFNHRLWWAGINLYEYFFINIQIVCIS